MGLPKCLHTATQQSSGFKNIGNTGRLLCWHSHHVPNDEPLPQLFMHFTLPVDRQAACSSTVRSKSLYSKYSLCLQLVLTTMTSHPPPSPRGSTGSLHPVARGGRFSIASTFSATQYLVYLTTLFRLQRTRGTVTLMTGSLALRFCRELRNLK